MLRAAFLSAGLYLALCGTGLLVVDDVRLTDQVSDLNTPVLKAITHADEDGRQHFHPPEWMPFTFIGVGGVTMLYAVALPRR